MTQNEFYLLKGYIRVLESLPPNGRYIHQLRNKLTGLHLLLFQNMPIQKAYEIEVRLLINKINASNETCATDVQNIVSDDV